MAQDNNQPNVINIFDDEQIKIEVEELWGNVFRATYSILKTADMFGFEEIEIKSNPNIHQLIAATATMEFWLDTALAIVQNCENVEHGLIRMILNAKQNVNHMQAMAAGLKTNDRELYDEALNCLRNQAQI